MNRSRNPGTPTERLHSLAERLHSLARVALLLILAASCAHAEQSLADAKLMLTKGTWLEPPARKTHIIVYLNDGTFLFFRPGADGLTPVMAYSGTWGVENRAIVVRWKNGAVGTVNLPVTSDKVTMTMTDGSTTTLPASPRLISADEMQRAKVTIQSWGADTKVALAYVESSAKDEASAPAPAAAPIGTLSPGDVVRQHRDSLVFVTGSSEAGSGFIVKIGTGGNYLITNVHVAAGIDAPEFQSLDGTQLQQGIASIGVGEDIFCMSLPAGSGTSGPFEIMQNVDQNAQVGDRVVVLGNAEGGGVINTITGKIVGIGPNLVEVDAPFVPGNSGSPIVHLKSGKVIGVATYLIVKDFDFKTYKELKNPQVRRFGYRLDTVKSWQQINWPAFRAQAGRMDAIKQQTQTLIDLCIGIGKGEEPSLEAMSAAMLGHYKNWMASKAQHLSAEDAAESDAEFLAYLRKSCTSDIAGTQGQISYDYFRRQLTEEQTKRGELSNAIQQAIREVGQ